MLIAAEDRSTFVDLDVSVGAWIALLAVIVAMLAIDLYRHREAHAPTPKEAATESIIWVTCGLAFGAVIAVTFGSARVRRVHQRLPDREVAQRRQRVRLVDACSPRWRSR